MDKTPFDMQALRELCNKKRIGMYLENAARQKGWPHIALKARGLTLAVFHHPDDAARWLAPNHFLTTESKQA